MPFRDVSGHLRIVDLLKRSIEGGTLPQSLLFSGPAGSGKRLTAIATAQLLNCLQPRGDACGTCAACDRIARGVHPDFTIVEPGESGAIKIDQVRDVVDRAGYRPFEGKRRVIVFDEADALVTGAQNALLKTLEEPPSSSTFILVTARPDVLLPTVRSRCIQLSFAGGAAVEIDEDARDVAVRVLSHAARGSDPARRLDGAKELLGNGDRERVVAGLRAMAAVLRDIEAVATGADAAFVANHDARPALEQLAPAFKGARGVDAFAAVDRALVALAPPQNAGVKVVADWVVLQL